MNPGLILCRFSLVDHKLLSSEPFMENQLCKTCSDMERKIIERKLLSPGFEPMNSRSQCIHSTAVLQPLPFIVKIRPKILFALIQSRRDFFQELLETNLRLELLLRFKIREKQNEAKSVLSQTIRLPFPSTPSSLSFFLFLYQARYLYFVQSKDFKRLF